jgi:hypothetical protein
VPQVADLESVEQFFDALHERGDFHLPNGSILELFRGLGPDDELT